MIRLNDGRLVHEMFQAYRSDLESAALQWHRAMAGKRAGSDSLQRASEVIRTQQLLDQAHPFLPQAFLKRLQERISLRLFQAAKPGEETISPAEMSRLVGDLLAEAEWSSRQMDDALRQAREQTPP
jgi:hypothetical protein